MPDRSGTLSKPTAGRRVLWADARWLRPEDGRVEAGSLYVWGERIAGAGDESELIRRFGPPDERIALNGRILLPGLTDAHCHLVGFGMESTRAADLAGSATMEELIARLKAHADRSAGEWILGRGFDQDRLKGERYPHRRDLDAAFPDRPVVFTRICWHVAVANSLAMRRANLSSEDGLFAEDAVGAILSAVPPPTTDELLDATRHALKVYNASGFTEAHVIIGGPDEAKTLQTLRRAGDLTLRIRMIVPFGWLDALESCGFVEGFGDEWLRLSALKSFADGSLGARTAAMREPYADDPGNRGLSLLEMSEIVRRIRRGHRAGLRSAIHAIGDRAVREVVEAAEIASGDGPPPRIEHASVTPPEIAEKMGALGMSAAVQPQFIRSDYWTPERLGPDRASWAYPFRTLLDSGVNLAGSTDCPVEKPEAWAIRANFIHRADGHESEALSPLEALRALTTGAERSLGEPIRPRFSEGAPADFLALSPGAEWHLDSDRPLSIERTVAGGKIVWDAERMDADR